MPRIENQRFGLGWLCWTQNDFGQRHHVRWGPTAAMALWRTMRAMDRAEAAARPIEGSETQ